jgi:hypothetical protein
VRWFPPVCLFLSLTTVLAQDQERRLIDRLLRPKIDLRNNAEGKEFPGANSRFTARSSNPHIFPLAASRNERSFTSVRTIVASEYHSRSFESDNRNRATVQTHSVHLPGEITPPVAAGLGETRDAHLGVATRTFAGQTQFQEQGKSQKSLNRHNPPLTIDQVRELLNKNK